MSNVPNKSPVMNMRIENTSSDTVTAGMIISLFKTPIV